MFFLVFTGSLRCISKYSNVPQKEVETAIRKAIKGKKYISSGVFKKNIRKINGCTFNVIRIYVYYIYDSRPSISNACVDY